MGLLKKLFGDYSTKEIKRVNPKMNKVLALEEEYSKLTDAELKAKPKNSKKDFRMVKPLTIFSPKHLLPAVRLHGVYSV